MQFSTWWKVKQSLSRLQILSPWMTWNYRRPWFLIRWQFPIDSFYVQKIWAQEMNEHFWRASWLSYNGLEYTLTLSDIPSPALRGSSRCHGTLSPGAAPSSASNTWRGSTSCVRGNAMRSLISNRTSSSIVHTSRGGKWFFKVCPSTFR